jgi:hypothetical protein
MSGGVLSCAPRSAPITSEIHLADRLATSERCPASG